MIISIHIPKTGGTSFRNALEQVYGTGLWLNYGDDFSFDAVPPGTECIHGHIPGDAYTHVFPGHQVATLVRHPVQRVVSNYYHLLRSRDPQHPAGHLLRRERFSLLDFAGDESVRNEATRYIARREPEDFDFVGITERYEESLLLYAKTFGTRRPLPLYHDNTNLSRRSPEEDYGISPGEYDAIAQLNLDDMLWYQRALEHFERTLASGLLAQSA